MKQTDTSVTVTLRFDSLEALDYFLCQMSDPQGQEHVFFWPDPNVEEWDENTVFDAQVFDMDGEEVVAEGDQ